MPRPAFAFVAMALALVASSACQTTRFYTQAIGGQWQLLSQKQPIPEVIGHTPETSPLREQLQLAQEIVAFAESELGLPVKGAYQDYVDLDRRYVVWNVQAAPEFSLESRTWWYPIVGSLEYRGYFKEELAIEHAERLKRDGEDVHVGGVAAYSTLGWFDDPVLNTFIDRPETDLAELLFHELAHRRLFFAGDTDFSEAFATAVGRESVRRWLLARDDSQTLDRYLERRQRDDQVIALILRKRGALESLYGLAETGAETTALSTGELRAAKREIIASLRDEYEQLKDAWPGYKTFDKFMADPINNARLNAVDTYFDLVPKFERLITATGGDGLTPFFELIESTKRMDEEERRAFLDAHAAADNIVPLPPRRRSRERVDR
jgi:predicted aminopeptidase